MLLMEILKQILSASDNLLCKKRAVLMQHQLRLKRRNQNLMKQIGSVCCHLAHIRLFCECTLDFANVDGVL